MRELRLSDLIHVLRRHKRLRLLLEESRHSRQRVELRAQRSETGKRFQSIRNHFLNVVQTVLEWG